MTTATWVRYGRDAASALRAEIARAKAGEPLAPVTVVVDSNQVGVSTRRLLASGAVGSVCGDGLLGGGLIGVDFVTPYRLAELHGAAVLAAQGRRPVSVPVLGAAVRHALAEDPGAFAPVAHHAATESALVAAYRELRDLDAAALDALAASSRRAAEVVRVHRATRARLEADWYDEEDLMAAAAGAVGTVIVHLPQRLSRHSAELLRRIGTTAVLAGTTGDPKADAEVARSVALLGVDLGPPPPPAPVAAPDTTRILTASDADDEVRAAVRAVIDAARDGTPLDRMAVLYAAPEPYGRLLQHHLAAAGVPTNGTATLPVAGRLAGRTLLGLLALPASGFRRQDVFAWLSGAPILHDGRWTPTTAWERCSRDAGVVAGLDDWDRRLARLDDERAQSLRTFVLGLATRLAEAAGPSPWSTRVRWTKRLLADLLGGANRRAEWPDAERRGAERLELALDRLAVLDDLEGPVTLDVFTRALTVELEGDLGRVGRFGQGALVGPVSMAVGVDLDLTVLVGMAEGTFPATLREDSLLPDEDRDVVALPLRTGQVDRLHHQFLAVLAGSHRHLLCVPKGDLRRSRERVPSRWVLDVASQLAGETWWSEQLLAGTAPWLTHLASFDDSIRTAASPATDQEHRLRALLAGAGFGIDPTLAAAAATVEARWSRQLTRFDGNLAGLPIPSPVDRGASATSLESWAKCPHGYFVAHVLRVRPIEPPEDQLQINALDRGTLVHEVLDDFLAEAIAQGRVPEPGQPWTDADHTRLDELAAIRCDQAEADGLTGRRLFWQRDRAKIVADLHRFLHEDHAHRAATGARPVATELPFDQLDFPLGDGRAVPLRGKADRVDVDGAGRIHVLDYKTGSTRPYTGLTAEDPHQAGRRLQLAVYGLAARRHLGDDDAPVRAEYWFTSAKGRFEKLGYDITDEVLAQVTDAMTTIVAGIEAGMFAPHPAEHTTSPFPDCPACDPDNLGTTELRRQFEAKLGDPAIATYAALIGGAE